MELKKYKLGDIADIINGATPSTSCEDNYDGEIVWITPKDLSDQKSKYIEKGSRKITQKGYDSCSTQMIPSYNILMSSRAPIGLLAINKVDCCTNQGFKNIIVNKSICNVDYLYYYLKFHIKEIEALGSGTTFKEVSKVALQKFEINIPTLEEQKRIGNLLSALDQKIALNRKINDNLEAMAKQLYDYWFVQFDFPNEEGKPYKSSGCKMVWNEKLKREIPEGWEVKEIKTFAEVKRGSTITKAQTSEGNIKVISAGTSYSFLHNEANRSAYIITVSASGANAGFINFWREPIYASDCSTIQCSKIEETLYCYYWIIYFQELLFTQQIGAAQPHVYPEHINKIPIVIPPIEIFNKIKNELISINKQQRILIKQIENLTKQRDELLPLLMNGQVSVN